MIISDQSLYTLYLIKHLAKQNKGSKGSKDSERRKTYVAEWAFARSTSDIKGFKNVEGAQKFVTKVCRSETWKKLWIENSRGRALPPEVPVRMKKTGHGSRTSAFTNGSLIVVDPMSGLDSYTMLHELAHCLGHMHHGRSFRKDLLKLVSRFISSDAAKKLKAEFKKAKLACGEPRKPMKFEQWLAAKNKMKKIREMS